jgi:AcrR family transcriptional regulator
MSNGPSRFTVPPPGSLADADDAPVPSEPHARAPRPRKKGAPRRRDAEQSRKLILQAALEEFSTYGHSGARVERIADLAQVSKPLIYDYFGDKDGIYAAALKEDYVQIRQGERDLNLDDLAPDEAVRTLCASP